MEDWTKEYLLIAVSNPGRKHMDGNLYTFYRDPKDGAYLQEPEYVDYIIRNLGLGQYNIVGHNGTLTPIDFIPVTVNDLDWIILDPIET